MTQHSSRRFLKSFCAPVFPIVFGALFAIYFVLFTALAGCGSATSPEYQRIVERISGIVGRQLDLNVREVDIDVPLSKQKKVADDLDVVEIIMNVENAFNIEIKDEEVGRDLSVKKLADIVSRKKSLK